MWKIPEYVSREVIDIIDFNFMVRRIAKVNAIERQGVSFEMLEATHSIEFYPLCWMIIYIRS